MPALEAGCSAGESRSHESTSGPEPRVRASHTDGRTSRTTPASPPRASCVIEAQRSAGRSRLEGSESHGRPTLTVRVARMSEATRLQPGPTGSTKRPRRRPRVLFVVAGVVAVVIAVGTWIWFARAPSYRGGLEPGERYGIDVSRPTRTRSTGNASTATASTSRTSRPPKEATSSTIASRRTGPTPRTPGCSAARTTSSRSVGRARTRPTTSCARCPGRATRCRPWSTWSLLATARAAQP